MARFSPAGCRPDAHVHTYTHTYIHRMIYLPDVDPVRVQMPVHIHDAAKQPREKLPRVPQRRQRPCPPLAACPRLLARRLRPRRERVRGALKDVGSKTGPDSRGDAPVPRPWQRYPRHRCHSTIGDTDVTALSETHTMPPCLDDSARRLSQSLTHMHAKTHACIPGSARRLSQSLSKMRHSSRPWCSCMRYLDTCEFVHMRI